MLPDAVLATIREDLPDWHGCGMSVLEMTHRGVEFGSILSKPRPISENCSRFPQTTTCYSCKVEHICSSRWFH